MKFLMNLMARIHLQFLRLSGGKLGARVGGQDVLLLHHRGRKSGKSRVSPLGFLPEGENFLVVASAAGQRRHPGWFHNLRAEPGTRVEIRGKSIPVRAEILAGDERERLWTKISQEFPQYLNFQKKTTRLFPLVLLRAEQ